MKKLLSLLLILTLASGCNPDDTTSSDGNTGGSTTIPVETDPVTDPVGGTTGGATGNETKNTFTEEFMDLVNAHRASVGLRGLIHSEEITQLALEHSTNMANGSVAFGHDGFSERCSAARVAMGKANACGENVAYGQKTPKAVFDSWMNSSGHRANIEKSSYTHSGFAFKKKSNGTIYWTHLFLQVY